MSNPHNTLEYLARIVFPGSSEGRKMIFVAPYIDESGTHKSAPILSLAGYLATVEKWGYFTNTWEQILKDLGPWQFPEQDYFHMQKFCGNFSPYEKFADYPKEKDVFANRIIDAIRNTIEYGFAVALSVQDYDTVVAEFKPHLGSAYTFCAQQCLAATMDWVVKHEAGTGEQIAPIIYTFEDGAEHEREAKAFLSLIADSTEYTARYRYKNHIFTRKRGLPPLQAADVYACETFRHLARERGFQAKGDYYLNRLRDENHECQFMDRGRIREIVNDTMEHYTKLGAN